MKSIAYVGMDVHQDFIEVLGVAKKGEEVLFRFRVTNEEKALVGKFRRLLGRYELYCCYEASGCGYVIWRILRKMGIFCEVIAPSLIPHRPGDRIKTDKRDALNLALLYRAGLLTSVHVPSEEEEKIRSLVRCREAINGDVVRSKQRILKLLQAKNLVYRDGDNWTKGHWQYLRSLSFEGVEAVVFGEYLGQLEYNLSRLRELDLQIEQTAKRSQYCKGVRALCCLRGVGIQTAMVILTELIDLRRFENPAQLMSYVGLVPGQYSSGNSLNMGPITKAGNSRCRWALVESAWHYRHKPAVGVRLKEAWKGQSPEIVAIAWKAQQRLYKKFWGIAGRKDRKKGAVAVARELVGFMWAIMRCE